MRKASLNYEIVKSRIMKRMFIISLLFILPFIQNGKLFSQAFEEETWKFPGKDTLSLETLGSTKVFISGSNSGEIEIKLRYKARPDEKFEVKERQRTIYLKEYILNYNKYRPTQTYFEDCTFIITIPHGMYVGCSGSSGEFKVAGFIGVFKAEYGLGKFIFNDVEGSIDLQLAQLQARIHNSKGSFSLSSASGLIRATRLTVNGNSSFMSGLGSIKISLARAPESDLYVGSNFNKAQVRLNGHPVTGYFEFIAMAGKGRIISPIKFDKEETFLDDIKSYRDSSDFGKKSEYKRKSFISGDSNPKITLKTVTGIAQLIK